MCCMKLLLLLLFCMLLSLTSDLFLPDFWMRRRCDRSPSWTSSSAWTRWRRLSRPQPSCYPARRTSPWTKHQHRTTGRNTLSSQFIPKCVPAHRAETTQSYLRCFGQINKDQSHISQSIFIPAGVVVLSMFIFSTASPRVQLQHRLLLVTPDSSTRAVYCHCLAPVHQDSLTGRGQGILQKLYESGDVQRLDQCNHPSTFAAWFLRALGECIPPPRLIGHFITILHVFKMWTKSWIHSFIRSSI